MTVFTIIIISFCALCLVAYGLLIVRGGKNAKKRLDAINLKVTRLHGNASAYIVTLERCQDPDEWPDYYMQQLDGIGLYCPDKAIEDCNRLRRAAEYRLSGGEDNAKSVH
jgi:hypothetical protein